LAVFLNTAEAKSNKLFTILNKDEHLKYSWVLDISHINKHLNPVIDNYKLEQSVGLIASTKRMLNKV